LGASGSRETPFAWERPERFFRGASLRSAEPAVQSAGMNFNRPFAILGLSLVLGFAVFGIFVGRAVKQGRSFDRYLSVRGLAEREVSANLAIWPVSFVTDADDLAVLKQQLDEKRAKVAQFLKEQGIEEAEITTGLPALEDRAQQKMQERMASLPRYSARVTIVVRSPKVDVVKKAIQSADRLLSAGVALSGHEYGENTEFLFTDLNAVKPDMIRDATANARAAAEKFAQDSKSKVGAIRQASQGVFEIESRDVASPEKKIVRVVTSVQFFLE
jgi:hypothetical protein